MKTESHELPGSPEKEALDALLDILKDTEAKDAARVSAARALLDRFSPKENAETKKRQAEERQAAIAEARCLMAEFAAAKSAGLHEPAAMAQDGAAEPANAAPAPANGK